MEFGSLERGNDSSSASQLFHDCSNSDLSLSTSTHSITSYGSGESKADRKNRRRKNKNRADAIRRSLANSQDVKRNMRTFRRSNSATNLLANENREVQEDAERVEECLRAMQAVVLQAQTKVSTRKQVKRRKSTGNLLGAMLR